MGELALRAAVNRQVLNRLGVAVFQAAEGEAACVELPAALNDLLGVRRRPAPLFKTVKGKVAGLNSRPARQFFDLEIARFLFNMHDDLRKKLLISRQFIKTLASNFI